MQKFKKFVKDHEVGLLIIGGAIVGGVTIGLTRRKMIEAMKSIGVYDNMEEAIKVFNGYVETKKDAAIFYENSKFSVLDL